MSAHKVNVNNFMVSKLNEEVESIEKDIEELTAKTKVLEDKISGNRNEMQNSEKELDEVNAHIHILRENKSALKEKAEVIKKDSK